MGHRWLTVAGVITHGPCKLLGLLVTPSAADAACTIYNGESTGDPIAFSILLGTKDSKLFSFPGGLELDRGLYISPLTNITGVLAIWEPG